MLVKDFPDIRDDIGRMIELLQWIVVLHEDVAQRFAAPIRTAANDGQMDRLLVIAQSADRACVKLDITNQLLVELQTIAETLETAVTRADKAVNTEAASKT